MMTEEEAKKRWCPFVRAVYANASGMAAVNRDGKRMHPGAACIASECMAWRWEFVETEDSKRHRAGRGISTYPPPEAVYEQTDKGCCGLAGRF